jgi:Prokaryotic homologs of the JAB domain
VKLSPQGFPYSRAKCEDVHFSASAFADLIAFVGHVPPETGGLLLGSRRDYVVKKFVFDESGSRSHSSYDPDVAVLNKIVKREWEENELQLIGWAHSHPRGVERLSGDYGGGTGDLGYLTRIFEAMPALPKFIVPIVFSSHDGPLSFFPYVAYRGNAEDYRLGRLVVHPASTFESKKKEIAGAAIEASKPSEAGKDLIATKDTVVNQNEETRDEPAHRSISTLA